jgi:preprotein translocase subunit SecG
MSAKKLMVIFTLLIFSIIYGIREWTRLKDFSGTTVEEKKEEFSDFMIYIIISLSTFLYANAYIRRKFNTGGTLSGGGDDGLFKDSLSKVSATNFGTLTIYVGMLVILLNIVTNTFQYLKNKKKNQKDKMLRAIYFGQISTMFQFIITSFFVMGFGMSGLRGKSTSQTFITGLKWIIVIAFSITSIHLINKATNFEKWFGEPKDVQHSNQK